MEKHNRVVVQPAQPQFGTVLVALLRHLAPSRPRVASVSLRENCCIGFLHCDPKALAAELRRGLAPGPGWGVLLHLCEYVILVGRVLPRRNQGTVDPRGRVSHVSCSCVRVNASTSSEGKSETAWANLTRGNENLSSVQQRLSQGLFGIITSGPRQKMAPHGHKYIFEALLLLHLQAPP